MTQAIEDLVLTPSPEPKRNHHITVALRHMRKQKASLDIKIEKLEKERDAVMSAIAEISK